MKKNTKLPTILGIIILLIGIISGIYLINSRQVFKLSADTEAIPKNVRFSNISDTSVSVSWTTDIASNGFVKWGTSSSTTSKVSLEENADKSTVHSVNVLGATNGSDVFIKINSDGKDYDNNGTTWQTNTSLKKVPAGNSLIASGTILLQDGSTPAKALVYLSINGVILSGITSEQGSFIIPVSNFIETISDSTAIEVTVNAGVTGTSQAVIYPKAIKAIPTMILGKTYDFRSLVITDSNTQPQSSLSVPESVEISSRFEITKTNSSPSSSTSFTIESIDEGEIITTTDPEFFGKGPNNSDIQVMVESELQEVALTTDSKGAWNWSPPNNLEPGEHKITLKWRDTNGILRTITRKFIVAASEGPAFESTPSANPTSSSLATSTPLSTSSATPKVSSTPKTTAPPTPETGSLTPTIGLFIMGIGILMSSLFVWNKSNA